MSSIGISAGNDRCIYPLSFPLSSSSSGLSGRE
jgi:hypothetical protein